MKHGWVITFVCLTLLCLVRAVTVRGLVSPAVTPDLGLMVARTAANEGAFKYRSTVALVWQVVRENGGKNNDTRADFLYRHSPKANGLRPCLRSNCMWSPGLNRYGVQPLGLNIRLDVWTLKVKPLWLDTLRYSDWLVGKLARSEDPCHVPPRTWGGPMDRKRAMERGLYPIGCYGGAGCTRDSCNDGFTWYADCWKDGFWVCDPEVEPVVQSEPESEGLTSL